MPRSAPTVAGPGMAWRRLRCGLPGWDEAVNFVGQYDDGLQVPDPGRLDGYVIAWTLTRPNGAVDWTTERQMHTLMAVTMFDTVERQATFAVEPEYRRRGVADRMLRFLLRMEVDQVTIRVAHDNEAGLAFASRFTEASRDDRAVSYEANIWDHFGEEVRCNCGPCTRQLVFVT